MAFIAPDSVADLAVAEPEPEAVPEAAKQDKPMLAVPFSLIPAQAVWWLWKGLIPFRHVTLFVAPGKTGKGTTLADIAARMTKGRAMPGDTEKRDPMNVVIIAPEDDANEALRPRLEAAGADMDKVFNLTKFSDGTQFYLPDNITDLAVAVEQIEKQTGLRVGLVIIDPVLAIVTKSINGNAAARSITNPLEDFAKQPLDFDPLDPDNEDAVHPGLAVVLTQHTTKAGKTASSQGLVDSVRMVVRVERLFPKQNEHPGRRIYVEATNLTDATRSERYTLVTTVLTDEAYPDGIEASYVTWAAEAKPEQGKPKVGHRGYTVAPKGGAHPAATKVPQAKPQAGDSQGSDAKPFRLIQRVMVPGAEPTLTPVGRYESMAAAMHAADDLAGRKQGWKHREAPPGYPAYTARYDDSAGAVVSFVAWDTREQGKAEAAAKAK
jgi:AAA domain